MTSKVLPVCDAWPMNPSSVVGGSAIAIALGAIGDAPLGVAAGVGGVAAIVSLAALLRYADRLLEERAGRTESLFPSPK